MTRAPGEAEVRTLTRAQRVRRRFLRHRVGVAGFAVAAVLYLIIALGPFLAPYPFDQMHRDHRYAPPTPIHFMDAEGRFHARPFVYGIERTRDPVTFQFRYQEDRSQIHPIRFLVAGEPYRFLGLLPARVRLFGLDPASEGRLFLFGTDRFGRDLWGRILLGGRVTLSVGIFGILLSTAIGVVMGGISGYYGGRLDNLIQRFIELLRSFPTLPLWLALSMILPPSWSSAKVYFGVVTVLSLIGWTGLARVVRGQYLALREKEFVVAAQALGATDSVVMFRHILPNITSYLIVSATLALPGMILGESSLSFLGLGIKEPMTSWGLLLRDAQTLQALKLYPWFLIPGLFIVVAVLAFNFLGDAVRDAFDPYARD
ncbi:peptide ABC transporter permease [Limnochorda pilosa]|uniref:Peptide ABC transporter permease n=1 Tax=Limnochorda pilosa TaxID=1555112 RepID=A0A0K2SMG8_LIMPI|nr:peptide ABC transporter permease [Limnochorda pilosa]